MCIGMMTTDNGTCDDDAAAAITDEADDAEPMLMMHVRPVMMMRAIMPRIVIAMLTRHADEEACTTNAHY